MPKPSLVPHGLCDRRSCRDGRDRHDPRNRRHRRGRPRVRESPVVIGTWRLGTQGADRRPHQRRLRVLERVRGRLSVGFVCDRHARRIHTRGPIVMSGIRAATGRSGPRPPDVPDREPEGDDRTAHRTPRARASRRHLVGIHLERRSAVPATDLHERLPRLRLIGQEHRDPVADRVSELTRRAIETGQRGHRLHGVAPVQTAGARHRWHVDQWTMTGRAGQQRANGSRDRHGLESSGSR